jgi:hypothetical protein
VSRRAVPSRRTNLTVFLHLAQDNIQLALSRRAADQIFDDPDGDLEFEPIDAPTAAAAVDQLAERWARAGGTVHQMRANARLGAETLSDDPLQGLSEILQNADDAEATTVRFLLDGDVLYVKHDGRPVVLKDVHFLATPWLTNKRGRGPKIGRFGIGMSTIHAIAYAFELHCGPYHVRFGEPNLENMPAPNLPPELDDEHGTVFIVHLRAGALEPDDLLTWAHTWDDAGLLFCAELRTVSFAAASGTKELTLTWSDQVQMPVVLASEQLTARIRTATAPDGRTWLVTTTEPSTPKGISRSHKKTDATTPIGVALAMNHCEEAGGVYAGLPLVPTRLPLRVNAQLDPVTGRRALADRRWNDGVLALVAALWPYAMLELFARTPKTAWQSVPLFDADRAGSGPLTTFETLVLERSRTDLPTHLSFEINGTRVQITRLATLVPELEGLLTDDEVATLASADATLPSNACDGEGRWRLVLADWRAHGSDIPHPVSVLDAVALIGDASRHPNSVIALTAAAIRAELEEELDEVECIIARDGRRLRPPSAGSTDVLVTHERGLASLLQMGVQLHPAYLADTPAAITVLGWLNAREATLDDDSRAIVARLSAAGLAGQSLPGVLTDFQLRALRDAFERLAPSDWTALGPGVGHAIRVECFQFDRHHRKVVVDAHPGQAYLPKAIEREPDGFHVAAATTPGIIWVATRYATVLKSDLGRTGLGAQRFLGVLGANTAPRVEPHHALASRYTYERRRGVEARTLDSPDARSRHLDDLGADYTLEDIESPDLEAVLLDIARDRKATSRRRRAASLLATLGRTWSTLIDSVQVDAARAYHSWQVKGPTRSWWLWRAATIPWLDNNSAQPSAPMDLRLRTAGTMAVHGPDDNAYLHRAFDSSRRDVLAALGVAGEPTTADLVERLRDLRDGDETARDEAANAGVVYRALAQRLASPARLPGDLNPMALRRAFNQGQGLIRTSQGWRPATHVLAGEPIFGILRTFIPQVSGADRLWQALGVRSPGMDDCLAVLTDLARDSESEDSTTQTITLETLRLLAHIVGQRSFSEAQRHRLAKVPLRTSCGWSAQRPIYAIDDPMLVAGLGTEVPVWLPGGDLTQFSPLIGPCRLTMVSAVAHMDGRHSIVNEDATLLLRDAINVLHEDLARNDPSTFAALRISWTELRQFNVRVTDSVDVVAAGIEGGDRPVKVAAYADIGQHILFVTDPEAVGAVDVGGIAIASLFNADRRGIAYAWLAAIQQARAGRVAIELRLAAESAEAEKAANAADIAARLAEFQAQAAGRRKGAASRDTPGKSQAPRSTGSESKPARGTSSAPKPEPLRPPRQLVDPDGLRVVDPDGKIVDPDHKGPTRPGYRRRSRGLADPKPDGAAPHGHSAARGYTELEKESLGFALACRVLASDADDMVDLRAQHNVGADAINRMRQFFELKIYAGTEPDVITLEAAQISRAMSTPDFFVVVVSNVEGQAARPKVRVIVDPIAQLGMIETSEVRFNGVRNSHSLVFEFAPEGDVPNG